MLTQKYKNDLIAHVQSIAVDDNQTQTLVQSYEDYFNSLGKYEQMAESLTIEASGMDVAYQNFIDKQ